MVCARGGGAWERGVRRGAATKWRGAAAARASAPPTDLRAFVAEAVQPAREVYEERAGAAPAAAADSAAGRAKGRRERRAALKAAAETALVLVVLLVVLVISGVGPGHLDARRRDKGRLRARR